MDTRERMTAEERERVYRNALLLIEGEDMLEGQPITAFGTNARRGARRRITLEGMGFRL